MTEEESIAITNKIVDAMNDFMQHYNQRLKPSERNRKVGSGTKNLGFIEKVTSISFDANEFAPLLFETETLRRRIKEIEIKRNILVALQSFSRFVSDSMLISSDEAYKLSLIYYNITKELSRRRNPDAQVIYSSLKPFFKKTRRKPHDPTQKEIIRDAKALIHGKKDGKIIIKNERPHLEGGKFEVIDTTHK